MKSLGDLVEVGKSRRENRRDQVVVSSMEEFKSYLKDLNRIEKTGASICLLLYLVCVGWLYTLSVACAVYMMVWSAAMLLIFWFRWVLPMRRDLRKWEKEDRSRNKQTGRSRQKKGYIKLMKDSGMNEVEMRAPEGVGELDEKELCFYCGLEIDPNYFTTAGQGRKAHPDCWRVASYHQNDFSGLMCNADGRMMTMMLVPEEIQRAIEDEYNQDAFRLMMNSATEVLERLRAHKSEEGARIIAAMPEESLPEEVDSMTDYESEKGVNESSETPSFRYIARMEFFGGYCPDRCPNIYNKYCRLYAVSLLDEIEPPYRLHRTQECQRDYGAGPADMRLWSAPETNDKPVLEDLNPDFNHWACTHSGCRQHRQRLDCLIPHCPDHGPMQQVMKQRKPWMGRRSCYLCRGGFSNSSKGLNCSDLLNPSSDHEYANACDT